MTVVGTQIDKSQALGPNSRSRLDGADYIVRLRREPSLFKHSIRQFDSLPARIGCRTYLYKSVRRSLAVVRHGGGVSDPTRHLQRDCRKDDEAGEGYFTVRGTPGVRVSGAKIPPGLCLSTQCGSKEDHDRDESTVTFDPSPSSEVRDEGRRTKSSFRKKSCARVPLRSPAPDGLFGRLS